MPSYLSCRLCWKVTLVVFASILAIEAVVLVPSYINYERDRLTSIAMAARQSVSAVLAEGRLPANQAALTARLEPTLVTGYRLQRSGTRIMAGGEALPPNPEIAGSLRERRRNGDPNRMLAAWTPDGLGDDYQFVAALDTSSIGPALERFVLRIAGLVLLIALFVTAVTMVVVQRMVLGPIIDLLGRIRDEDASAVDSSAGNHDELHQARQAFEAMLARNKRNLQVIAEREAQYRRLNAALDQRVAERTRELETANSALRHRAYHDELTGLPNRDLFHERLEQALAGNEATRACTAVMLVGFDHFASINGLYGYANGDEVLRVLGRRLTEVAPRGHTVARFGGGVFAIIAPCDGDSRDTQDLVALAERLQQAVEASVALSDRSVECLASVGISAINNGTETAESLMGQADIALTHARSEEAGRVRRFAAWMNDAMADKLDRIAALRRALNAGEFYLAYQAKCTPGGEHTGVEALVRWRTPAGESVSPGEFIPLAESTGLITSLGSWVLAEAVAQAARWYHAGRECPVAVNLSVLQLRHADIAGELRGLLAANQLPSSMIELEITESALMQDLEHASNVLAELSRLGVRLAIDDFGTGYSSLAYLARLPVDDLKIDKQFIDTVPSDGNNTALCRSILEMGRILGKRVIAEGVETAAQRDWLAAQGCRHMQGFLFAYPVTPAALFQAETGPTTDSTANETAI